MNSHPLISRRRFIKITAVGTFGASLAPSPPSKSDAPDFEPLKQILGLKLPPSDATMRYSAKIKTEAIARLGFYSVIKLVKKILKKPIQDENEQEIQALGDGIKRMKRETEKSIIASGLASKRSVTTTPILPRPATTPMSLPDWGWPAASNAPTTSKASDSQANATMRRPIRPQAPLTASFNIALFP